MAKEFNENTKRTGYIYPVLSEKDEFIPSSHVGMYALFRNPKNKNIYMAEQPCQKIRLNTFKAILEIFKKYGSPNFADLFNYNVDIFTELGLNHFARHPKIAPLSNVIECFSVRGKFENVYNISFAISREVLDYYFRTNQVPIMHRSKKKSRDLIIFGQETVKIGSDKINIDKSAYYRKFVEWCELQGVDQQEGLLMAFELLFDNYPLSSLLPTSEYDYITEFDKPLYARRKYKRQGTERHNVELSNSIAGLAQDIIARYNRDPENATKQMDFNSYLNNALYFLNSNMNLKYQNPELYQEQLKTERMIAYNKNMLERSDDNAKE